ncbi:PilZ domain-containing protein [Novosphingobium kaempferiae]|uniref:PilZ domain-containing protein n=1 Tax=Novosphingobium kaempferiae TaxID=2896849 RepID=UPI001E3D1D6E|nr:PilZ domain-containing protein [Novosphingobium kaempferiae]
MDARNWSRHIVEKEVACAVDGVRGLVFLYDLSMGGCMFEMTDLRDVGGRQVAVELYEYETTRGEVVWQMDRCVGVRFDTPIHDAVVRHLGFVPPVVPFEEQAPRDRFGRVLPPLDGGDRKGL